MLKLKDKKILTVFYSRKGENYVNGSIKSLIIGNTEVVAEMIKDITGCDTFQIETVVPYPKDYNETTETAKRELRENARPELSTKLENIDSYDIIFLGYPNWWNTMPMPVFTFLEEYDFSGKIIIPFCTHEGSGIGRSIKDIEKLCPNATVMSGFEVYGYSVGSKRKDVERWIEEIDK